MTVYSLKKKMLPNLQIFSPLVAEGLPLSVKASELQPPIPA
jgi:hypothetical protein